MRLRFPGVVPLEVWDLPVMGEPLQRWRYAPSFPARLADLVDALVREPPPRWSAEQRAAASAVRAVHVLGGGASDAVVEALQRRLPARRDPDPMFAAARAGCVGGVDLCADVGQTAIKLCDGRRAWRIERDVERAPLRAEVEDADARPARDATLSFVAAALGTWARTVLLALPCELDDDERLHGCTYAWNDPDPTWVAELRRATGAVLHVVNDAELAAVAAGRVAAPATLVLTIGFGVGAAVLMGAP